MMAVGQWCVLWQTHSYLLCAAVAGHGGGGCRGPSKVFKVHCWWEGKHACSVGSGCAHLRANIFPEIPAALYGQCEVPAGLVEGHLLSVVSFQKLLLKKRMYFIANKLLSQMQILLWHITEMHWLFCDLFFHFFSLLLPFQALPFSLTSLSTSGRGGEKEIFNLHLFSTKLGSLPGIS